MFPKSKLRIAEIQNENDVLKQKISERNSTAKALHDYGRQQALRIDDFFKSLLQENSNSVRQLLHTLSLSTFAGWDAPGWESWDPATSSSESLIRIGDLEDRGSDSAFQVPALIPFIGENRTVIIRCGGDSVVYGRSLLQSLVYRTACMLPHQARYTLLDPAGNGLAFPMRKSFKDVLRNVREYSGDVRRDLDEVILQIQSVIEQYLNSSVTSFDQVARETRVNEKFQFIFAADFPYQYDRRAIEALINIGNTGPKAGTYLFIHHNQNYELPRDISLDSFNNAVFVDAVSSATFTGLNLTLKVDLAPPHNLETQLIEILDGTRLEQPIEWDRIVGLVEEEWWNQSCTKLIETPIGLHGPSEELKLWLGVNSNKQPCAHGIMGGMTGAGKSNLYHALICGLAVRYSPEELRLYLIDGKEGVEFQPYGRLPHAEVVSLYSSPELSRSVLARLVAEKEYRNKIFSQIGVSDFTAYREKGQPLGKLPRIVLLVDEYQELFKDDKDGDASGNLLQLSQQGRSAGIHMLLASQSFGAAGMLNKAGIFGNLHLLIAMQMSAADVQALAEFGRKGKGLISSCNEPGTIVVNDKRGDDGSNILGKVAYLAPERRDQLIDKLVARSSTLPVSGLPERVVFNGNAQPSLADNPYLSRLLEHPRWLSAEELQSFARRSVEAGGLSIVDWFPSEHPRAMWLGQEFSVRGQSMIVLRRGVGENAMIVGGANSARYGMLASVLTCIAANADPNNSQFIIFDRSIHGSQWARTLRDAYDSILVQAGFTAQYSREAAHLGLLLDQFIQELSRRQGLDEDNLVREPSIFVMMTELDRIETLRRKADSYGGTMESPQGEMLRRLYLEGPTVGIHLFLSFSGVRPMANVIDERRGLAHFRHRVALQMSEDDSHTFTRSRKASQLQIEGPVPVSALYLDIENGKAVRFKPYTSDESLAERNESLSDQLSVIGAGLAKRRNQV